MSFIIVINFRARVSISIPALAGNSLNVKLLFPIQDRLRMTDLPTATIDAAKEQAEQVLRQHHQYSVKKKKKKN